MNHSKLPKRTATLLLWCVLLYVLTPCQIWANDDDYTPWALRDHYSLKTEYTDFKYDVKTAEWLVEVKGRGVIVNDAQCEIVFADGRVLRLSSLEAIKDQRDKFTGPLGDGTNFRSVFRSEEGLQITYTVARFTERPFILLHLTIENKSSSPVEIKAIRPVVFDKGTVTGLEDAIVTQVQTSRQGFFPTVQGKQDGKASLVRFELKDPKVILGIGLLQSGMMNSAIDLQPDATSWYGNIQCDYQPTLKVYPGKSIASDPVWLSFGINESDTVHQYHAWAESAGAPTLNIAAMPKNWVSIEQKQPVEDLYKMTREWEGRTQHALVPAAWEACSGCFKGDAKRYPKDMRKVAQIIVQNGLHPGITVDPLSIEKGKEEWILEAKDGTRWLDISHPAALQYGATRMQEIVDWGYHFFAVEASAIPDALLRDANVTRAQANAFALEIMAKAAAGRPVFPSASKSLGGNLEHWKHAADSTGFYQHYGLIAAPVQLNFEEIGAVPPALINAIEQYAGPIEFIGIPKRKVFKQLNALQLSQTSDGLQVSSSSAGN